jgi:hypothetical protein
MSGKSLEFKPSQQNAFRFARIVSPRSREEDLPFYDDIEAISGALKMPVGLNKSRIGIDIVSPEEGAQVIRNVSKIRYGSLFGKLQDLRAKENKVDGSLQVELDEKVVAREIGGGIGLISQRVIDEDGWLMKERGFAQSIIDRSAEEEVVLGDREFFFDIAAYDTDYQPEANILAGYIATRASTRVEVDRLYVYSPPKSAR